MLAGAGLCDSTLFVVRVACPASSLKGVFFPLHSWPTHGTMIMVFCMIGMPQHFELFDFLDGLFFYIYTGFVIFLLTFR